MRIYFAVNEFEDLESHFDLEGVYLSKEDLMYDLPTIEKNGHSVYYCDDSVIEDTKTYKYRDTFHYCNISKLLNELKEQNEYKEYLRLKEKYGE